MTTWVIPSEHGDLAKRFNNGIEKYLIHHATRQYWAFLDTIRVLDIIETGEFPATYPYNFYGKRVREMSDQRSLERCVYERLVGFLKSQWHYLSTEQQQRAQKLELHP